MEAVFEDMRQRMRGTLDALRRELGRLRTGRASVTLLAGIKVNYHGTPTPLNQLASLSAPEPHLLVVQPWDPSAAAEVEKAIRTSDLGLNPAGDGKVIRVPIPPLTEERRRELVKHVKKMAEEHKVALRNIRRDGNEALRAQQRKGALSEDDLRRGQGEVQKVTDEFVRQVDGVVQKKEQEILEV
ncbi:MAG: ribosome recycling factor [Nitrospinota bacterium]